MRSIAWISEKGGTGKTTCAINSAVGLAQLGNRVLLVDTDPSGNASLVLTEGQGGAPPTLAEVLLGSAGAAAAIHPTRTPGLEVLPAGPDLADASLALASMIGRENRLRAALANVAGGYDYVLLDTSPTRSVLTINALTTAAEVLIPIEPSLFSLAGLGTLQAAVADVRRYLGNPELRIAGLVLTRTRRDNVTRDVEGQLRATFGPLVMAASIPQNVRIEEAHGRWMSVLDYAPNSPGAKAYIALVGEIIHVGTQSRAGTAPVGTAEADHGAAAA